ncbi:MAG: hypothetical protein K0R49_449 [Burkholderiales bacterium]|nr:hypothetical protein [Burkholderiales bacterium]
MILHGEITACKEYCMMHKCAILQSNYIPWKGVFDMINQVDTFVFFEDVDFTKRDWRTRNQIKTANGLLWLIVPVKKSPRGTKIFEINISQIEDWQENHYQNIVNAYKKSPYFHDYVSLLEKIYLKQKWVNLSEFNIYVTKLICEILGIKTKFINSKDLLTSGNKDDKLIEICKNVGADFYLSGPAAKDYINNQKFVDAKIQLAYINYNYPMYKQLYGEFNHYVTVLDLLLNCGEDSVNYIKNGNFELVK